MNCLPTSKCTEREFDTTKYIVSNCNVIEVTLTQKQNTDCTTEFVSLLDASGNSYPETSEFVSVNNQISRVIIDGLSTCVADAMGGGSTIPTVQDCDGNDAVPVYDPCAITAINTAKDAIVAAINGRPDYTAQLTSIGDTLTAIKSDTAAINTGVASSLVLLQAIVDKPDPTPVDLQPVLDRLDALIALETTENSTLVDVKNQLVAANVTLSNAETLLTHIDADMHDVVAKLQSALDLLTSLQTLLTTIDGRIAAIQTAITTADANNVSALNDIKTELQAINVNTDTLEALITACNVLLTAIVNNTDEVEGLLTEIRDLPVTDSWFLLYDNNDGSIGGCKPFIRRIVDNVVTDTELDLTTPYTVGGEVRTSCPDELQTSVDSGISTLLYDFVPSSDMPTYVEHVDDQTMQSFYTFNTVPHPSGVGVTFPEITQPSDYQYVIVPITNLTVGATVYVNAIFYDATFPQPLTYIVQETGEDITKDYNEQVTFVATETTHYLMLFAMVAHDEFSISSVIARTSDVSQDSCTPFFRKIVDGVVTDMTLDGQPYTVGGEVRTSCPDAQTGCTCTADSGIVLSLVDYVAERTLGGSIVRKTPTWYDGNGWQFVPISGTPITSWDSGFWGYTDGTDANTSFKVVTQISVESGKSYNINNSVNWTQQAFRYIIDGVEYPIDNFYETKTWVATTTGSVEVGVVVGTNATPGGFNDFYVETLEGETVVPATCTNFVRKIVDGVVTDMTLDGQPYIVRGEVRTSCPDAQTIAPLEQPTHTPVSVTSGSYTLAAGVKSYSITFVAEGAISGAYRPAGYSTNADYVEQGYATALTVTGASFIIEEVR